MITTDINGNTLSADFITAISADNPQYLVKILCEGVELDCSIVRITITKGSCGSENGFTIGSVVGSTLTAEVMNLTTAVKGKELEVRLGLLVNDSYTWIRLGYFTVSEAPQTAYATTITAYGKAITKTGDAFVAPATQTLANVASSIASSMSALAGQTVTVTFDSGITTSNTITKSMNGLTVYQALEILASVCGGYAVDTNDGNIKICRFSDTATLSRTTATMMNLPVVEESNFEIAGVLVIVVPETEDEEGTVVPAQTFPATPTGNENLIIQNEYMTQALYTANLATLTGYEYRPATMEFIYGDPRLEGNDVLSITDVDGSVYICPCHMVTHVYSGGLSTQVTSASATAQENEVSSSAGSLTETLSGISENAISARVSAESAKAYAEEAKQTTDEINAYAETVSKTVTQVLEDGETAGQSAQQALASAQNASEYASRALGNLASVQSVTETLNWITEHGTMTLTADQSLDPTHVYFVLDDTDGDYHVGQHYYSIVIEPNIDNISTYYELSIDQSLNNYVGTHLALDNDGLWLLPASTGTYKILISPGNSGSSYPPGMYIINSTGGIVARYMDYIVLGDESKSYTHLDYHSMQMFGIGDTNPFFHISDLRDENGEYNAVDTFTGNGTNTTFNLSMSYKSITSVTIDDVTQTEGVDYTRSGSYSFIFTTAPISGAIISISYVTGSTLAKAYTLGLRSSGSKVAPMSFAEGYLTIASNNEAHAEGYHSTASGQFSHAENWYSTASGQASHAEGYYSSARGQASHAEGAHTTTRGQASHAEGWGPTASGNFSHAECDTTTASGEASHAEGYNTTASGRRSHAENHSTTASGEDSHAEGCGTIASGGESHAEGYYTNATNFYSHSEGFTTSADGVASHAEGCGTVASGVYSHAQNEKTLASKDSQTVLGTYNIEDDSTTTTHPSAQAGYGKYSLIIGNGTDDSNRSNALTVDWGGKVTASSHVQAQSSILDRASTTAPSSTNYGAGFYANDKNGDYVARFTSAQNTNNSMGAMITGAKEVNGTVKTNGFFVYVDASGNPHYWVTNSANFRADLSIQEALSTSSWTPSITRTSGGTVSSLAGRTYGKVVTLRFVVTYSTSVSAGGNVFTGKLTNSGYIPPFATFASTYYGSVPLICQLDGSGNITCRVTGSSAVTISSGCTFAFTYIV